MAESTGTNHSATLRVRVATRAKNLRMRRLHRSPPATRDPITWSRQPRSILIRHVETRCIRYVESKRHVQHVHNARCRQVIASGGLQRGLESSKDQDGATKIIEGYTYRLKKNQNRLTISEKIAIL